MKTAVQIVGSLLLVGLLISCPLLQRDYSIQDPGEEVEAPNDGLGTLEIIFGAETPHTKTLVPPPVELDIVRYDIDGMLEGEGDSFSASMQAGEALTKTGLAPGSWSISVDAINGDETTIGHGISTAEIVAGESTTVRIMISPSSGSGTLDLTIQWKKQLFDLGSESISATVTPAIGGESSLNFHPIVEEGAYHFGNCYETVVPAGYYLVTMQLSVYDQQVWGLVEAVIIFEGATTSHIYTYTQK